MPKRVLSAAEFTQYAHEQISAADALLQQHRPASRSYCQCGRPLPCTQADTMRARKDHYLTRLALAEATVRLPVVTTSPPSPRSTRLRAVLFWITSRR